MSKPKMKLLSAPTLKRVEQGIPKYFPKDKPVFIWYSPECVPLHHHSKALGKKKK